MLIPTLTYVGRENQLRVAIPRVDDRRCRGRPAQRAGVAAGGSAHRILGVLSPRRDSRRGFHAGARLVFADRRALRHPRLRAARRAARDAGGSRQDLRRRQRANPARDVQRSPAGLRLCGQSAGRPDGWHARGTGTDPHRRLDPEPVRTRRTGFEPGFRIHVQGTAHRRTATK